MSAQDGYLGQLFVLKYSEDNTTFTTLGGLKATDFELKMEAPDVTNKDSNQWTHKLEGGIKSASISGSGIWRNETTQRTATNAFLAGAAKSWKIVAANGDAWTGKFLMTSYKRTGAHDGAEEFSLSLESSGEVAFAPGAA